MDGQNLVCFLTLVFVPSLCWAFGYTCYPDNTITVTGLGSSTTAVFAKNSDGVNCITSAPADTVNITNCSKDKYIVFSFGSYDGMSANQIIGGSSITVVNITCNEIEPTGHTINNTFAASIQYNETQAIDVTYNVWSDLDKTSANVGEQVIWSIYFPREYYLEVHYCTANPGTSYNADTSIELISNYCTQSTDLISNFIPDSGVAAATINAFKFYENADVFLYCFLTVCPTETDCIISCQNPQLFFPFIGKRQVKERGSSDGRFTSEIAQVLRITDPNANGAKPLSGLSIALTVLIVLASLF